MSQRPGDNPGCGAGRVSPFIKHIVQCSFCRERAAHYTVKSNMFNERSKDLDLRPLDFICIVRDVDPIYPPLYYLWSCPACHFTAASSLFDAPFQEGAANPTKLKQTIVDLQTRNESFKSIVQSAAAGAGQWPRGFEQAVRLTLLAIAYLETDEEVRRNCVFSLGRYYLRLSWLLHEITEMESGKKEAGAVGQALESIKSVWPQVPGTKMEAQQRAADYLTKAMTGSYAVKTPSEQVELAGLVAGICMKLGDMERAKVHVQTAREWARKAVAVIEEQLRAPDTAGLSDAERTKMRATVRKLEAVVDHMRDVFDDLRAEWADGEADRAQELIAKHPLLSPEELRRLLIENGIDETIAVKLTPLSKPKKGLFGLF